MVGSFKILKANFLLCLFVGCINIKQEEIGKNIIKDNIDLFISNLYGVPSKNAPIILIKKVGGSNFIEEHCESIIEMRGLNLIEDCKKDLIKLINKEGFSINENTKYLSFDIDEFPNKRDIRLATNETSIGEEEYVEVIFSNLYIDKKMGKAFIIVQESDIRKDKTGGKVDIYFFEKKASKWYYIKKQMLLTA